MFGRWTGQTQNEEGLKQSSARMIAELTKPTRLSLERSMLVGVYVPTFFFAMVILLFTFAYHRCPVVPWIFLLLGAQGILIGGWPPIPDGHLPGGNMTRNRWDWFPLICGILSLFAAAGLGLLNTKIMEPWLHAEYLNSYSNVQPNDPPEGYSDSGVLNFADGTWVDVDSAAGFRNWPHVYCAAPIVNVQDSVSKIGFWAVGLDCCHNRGGFSCGDAGEDKQAGIGLRIESHPVSAMWGHSANENYLKAVKMAAAAYGLTVQEPLTLVVWSKDPYQHGAQARLTSVVLCFTFIALAVCLAAVNGLVITQVKKLQS